MAAKSYTYLGLCPRTRRRYIGVRWRNIAQGRTAKDDLGKHYFSSSKHLPDNMLWRVLKEHDTPEEARAHERELHQRYDVARSDRYFNLAEAGPTFYNQGPLSEEHKRKISEANKSMVFTEEHRRKISEAGKGRKLSEDHKRKLSEVMRNPSVETRRKISEAKKGKKFTEEHRRKISEVQKGKKLSEETRRKISEAQGKHVRLTNVVTEEVFDFPSLTRAGEYIGVTGATLSRPLSEGYLYKRTWRVERITQ